MAGRRLQDTTPVAAGGKRGLVIILLLALACGCSARSGEVASKRRAPSVAQGGGRDDVAESPPEPSPIAVENQLPGTDDWRIATSGQGAVEGYASTTSAVAGDTVQVHVNTDRDRAVSWTLYRMGYYQRHGAREIASGDAGTISRQMGCAIDSETGMVECNWEVGFEVVVDPSWLTGQYFFKLSADGHESYVPLVVKESQPRAPIVVQSSVTTWQAYNYWGNASLYRSKNKAFTGSQAYRVSFDRPYGCSTTVSEVNRQPCEDTLTGCTERPPGDGSGCVSGSGDFFKGERWIVEWLERKGYDVAYVTNIDVDAAPEQLMARRLFVSMGHDEYWSLGERNALESARDDGVSLAILSGNTGYWRMRFGPSSSGFPRRTISCYRQATLDPEPDAPDTTVSFRSPPFARPEETLLGVMYQGITEIDAFPHVVSDASHWIYEGTGARDGDVLANIVGNEWDYVVNDAATPPGIETIAHAVGIRRAGAAWPADSAVYYPTASSLVFAAGTIQWSWGLGREDYSDPRVQRMTENVLARAGIPIIEPTVVPDADTKRPGSPWEPRVLAGSGQAGYQDGDAQSAQFDAPAGVARAPDGTIYVTDQRNHRVRAISRGGVVSTLAGCGDTAVPNGSYSDGTGADACFSSPTGIAVGNDGVIYVADTGNHCIRAVTSHGVVTTFAGSASTAASTDATNPLDARFSEPRGLAVGPDGALYVADSGNEAVRKVTPGGVTTVAVKIPKASGVAVALDGTIYALSGSLGGIYQVGTGGAKALTVAAPGDREGPVAQAMLRGESGAIVEDNRLIFSDTGNYKLRALTLDDPSKVVTLISGDTPQERTLHLPRGLASSPDGWIVADAGHNRVVMVPRSIPGGQHTVSAGPVAR